MNSKESRTHLLRRHLASLLLALVAVPILVLSLATGLGWLGQPFPGFFVGPNAVIPSVSGVDWPRDKDALFHAEVVAMDGQSITSGAQVYARVIAAPVGTKFRYVFRKNGTRFEKTIGSRTWTLTDYFQTWGITTGFGIISILVGLIVAALQPTSHQARVFRLQAAVGGLYALTAVFLHQGEPLLLAGLCLALECLFPATFIHLALVFPVERHFGARTRILRVLPYLLSLVLMTAALRGYFAEPPDLFPLRIAYVYSAISIVLFVVAMAAAWVENRNRMVRARIAALLPGLVLGTTAMLFAFLNNAWSGGNFPVQLPLVATLIFYGSLGYSITRHELFGIDRVVRQSFVYGVLSAILLAGYALAILVPGRLLPNATRDDQALIGGAFVILLAFLFDPLRRAVQVAIDRAFFRSTIDHSHTISALSESLTTLLDRREIAASVATLATDSLELTSATLVLAGDQGGQRWRREAPNAELREATAGSGLLAAAHWLGEASETADTERILPALRVQEPEAANALAALEARVAFPLMVRGASIGLLALGAKRSGREIPSAEVDLLRTLSHQAAIALQNARSYEDLETLNRDLDLKVQQRTSELADAYDELKNAQAQLVQSEKLASLGEFVAGAAHELNNPASFVRGSLQILTEFLSVLGDILAIYRDIPVSDPTLLERLDAARAGRNLDDILRETPELLRICNEGAERIERTVSELKVFVRKDRGDRAATDIGASLDATLRLLGPRIRAEGVLVKRNFAELQPIEADSATLGQVWMNLIANALDAIRLAENPCIEITLAAIAGNQLEVRINDNGPGIAADVADRLFEPFVTTKDVGQGTGLGLSIAYGAIKSHGGTLTAGASESGGASLRVLLPRTPDG
ncbi:MAG: ATP-binding protein [Deltaproteobacteria bacterium]